MVLGDDGGYLLQHRCDLIRFGGQNQDLGGFHHFAIVGGEMGANFQRKMLARAVMGISGDDLPGKNQFRVHESLGQGGGHLTRAKKTDFKLGCHQALLTGAVRRRKLKYPGFRRLAHLRPRDSFILRLNSSR